MWNFEKSGLECNRFYEFMEFVVFIWKKNPTESILFAWSFVNSDLYRSLLFKLYEHIA